MTDPPRDLPSVAAILSGPHWPDRVRVVQVQPRSTTRVAPALHLAWDPAHHLHREEVAPNVRCRVGQQGWRRMAESAADYEVSPKAEGSHRQAGLPWTSGL